MLVSVLPGALPFEVFSLTVGSLITAFLVLFETVLFTACATWFGAGELMQATAAAKDTVVKDETATAQKPDN